MVEAYRGFKASDGLIFGNELDAHTHELKLWLTDNVTDNIGIVNDVANAITSDIANVVKMLKIIDTLTPQEPQTLPGVVG